MKIKNLEITSNYVMPPMATTHSTPDGFVTDDLCEYYKSRVKGGYFGIVITEHCYVHMSGRLRVSQYCIADDDHISGMKKLVDTIHACGSKVFCQINHCGSAGSTEVTGQKLISASAIRKPFLDKGEIPEEMTVEQIHEAEEWFADAALRAKEAGYDGVEIHAAHGYLLNQFYSPLSNKRTDAYGGCLENRIRMHLETIRKVREKVGEDYPVAIRLGGCDYAEGGSTIEDAVYACKAFEKAGIDLLDLTGGLRGYMRPDHTEAGYFSDMTKAVKAEVNVPVILTGGVNTKKEADQLIADDCADLIGIGRAVLKDAEWAAKELNAE